MVVTSLIFLTGALYLTVAILLWQQFTVGKSSRSGLQLSIHAPAFAALVLHAYLLFTHLYDDQGLNLALANAISLVAWVVVTLFVLTTLLRPVHNLGIFIMPLATLVVFAQWLWPGAPLLLTKPSLWESIHITISLLAYGLLAIAAAQSLLLIIQENQIRHRHPAGFIRALPPLETMELLMFQMIGVGFILLTLTLITGLFFSEELFNQPLRFSHHIVLSISSWLIFLVLLLGHWRFGWRGRIAANWTLGAFVLLVLAYFGTKFVLEILLKKP